MSKSIMDWRLMRVLILYASKSNRRDINEKIYFG